MYVYGSSQAWVWVCVYVSSSTKYLVDSYLSVSVMEALLEVLIIDASRCMCVDAPEIKGEYGDVYVCMSVIFTIQYTATFSYMYILC